MAEACRLAKRLGLPLTFRNLYVIDAAIAAESEFLNVDPREAADTIIEGAIEHAERGEEINYFFFEDCRWRYPRLTWAEKEAIAERQLRRARDGSL